MTRLAPLRSQPASRPAAALAPCTRQFPNQLAGPSTSTTKHTLSHAKLCHPLPPDTLAAACTTTNPISCTQAFPSERATLFVLSRNHSTAVWSNHAKKQNVRTYVRTYVLVFESINHPSSPYGSDGSSSLACLHHLCEGMWNAGGIGRR